MSTAVNKSRVSTYDIGIQPLSMAGKMAYNTLLDSSGYCTSVYNAEPEYAKMRHITSLNNATKFYSIPFYLGNETLTSTGRPKPLFNDCFHTKLGGFNYPFMLRPGISPASVDKSYCGGRYKYTWIFAGNRLSPVPSLTPTNEAWIHDTAIDVNRDCMWALPNARRAAWHSMQPRFEGRISLINALFELKDFRDILSTFNSLKPWKIPKMLHRNVPRSALKDPSLPLAELHLLDAFAIQPLIKDIAAVQQQLFDIVDYVQQQFADLGDLTQKSHYTEHLCEINEVTNIQKSYARDVFSGRCEQTTFTATMEYQYDYRTRSLWDAFIKYWGLGITYEALWNATPFTFVWDYFNKMAKSIHMMQHDNNVDLRYSQYCESLLRTRVYGTFFGRPTYPRYTGCTSYYYKNGTGDGIALGDPSPATAITGYYGSTYIRRVCNPNKGAALPTFKLPTNNQWKNMAALVRCLL